MVNHILSPEMLDTEREELEDRLAQQAGMGDTSEFSTICELYHSQVQKYLTRKYPHVAEDATQDAFANAYVAIEGNRFRYEGRRSLFNWIMRIGTNKSIDYYRRSGRAEFTSLEDVEHTLTAGGDFTEDIAAADAASRLLETVTPAHAKILQAIDIRGERYDEFAADNDLNMGTVRSRLHRARHELRQNLEQQDSTE
jgi:RNA polymerase sigma-70 factor, ECF subfamily